MHTKKLGTYGEMAVATYLYKQGYSVFIELGDISRIDLIVETNTRLLKIQVKAVSIKDGKYTVSGKKSGPNYQFCYTEEDVDVFAVFCVEDQKIAWLNSVELSDGKCITLRVNQAKNGQMKGVRLLDEYTSFERILRDYTQDTPPTNVEGNDIVQTTTEKSG